MQKEVKVKIYKKRGKGKLTADVGMHNIYKYYRTRSKNPIDKIKIRAIMNDINLKIRDRIINESEYFKMPFGIGILRIRKSSELSRLYKISNCPVNYKLTRELGQVVYHDSQYMYRWNWVKYRSHMKWKSVYKFEPSRASKRLLAKAILVDKKDYFFEF